MKYKNLRKFWYALLFLCLLFFAAVIILFPERYLSCAFEGIALWAKCVLPSLFPFMVITLIFIKSGIVERVSRPLERVTNKLHLPKCAAILFVMSILSSYPAGSRMIAEYYDGGIIDEDDCKKLSILCSTSGPLFIIGSVGFKMFGDKKAGLLILFAHILSILIIALIYSFSQPKSHFKRLPKVLKSDNILYDAFYSATISVIVAGGFICFFYTLAKVLSDFNMLYPLRLILTPVVGSENAKGICYGLIEATGGCAILGGVHTFLSIPSCGFLITFGGLSILLQQLCYLIKCKVKPLFFISIKFFQGVLCFVILLIFCAL